MLKLILLRKNPVTKTKKFYCIIKQKTCFFKLMNIDASLQKFTITLKNVINWAFPTGRQRLNISLFYKNNYIVF